MSRQANARRVGNKQPQCPFEWWESSSSLFLRLGAFLLILDWVYKTKNGVSLRKLKGMHPAGN